VNVFLELVHGGQMVTRRQVDQEAAVCVEERAREHVDGLRPPLARRSEGALEVGDLPDL